MIPLDTNFLIQSLVPGTAHAAKLEAWLANAQDLGISTIAWSEFLCGPLTSKDKALAELLFPFQEPFLSPDAAKSAELFNATGRRSRTLADCQIAAVALRCHAKIATRNAPDFMPFQSYGLDLA